MAVAIRACMVLHVVAFALVLLFAVPARVAAFAPADAFGLEAAAAGASDFVESGRVGAGDEKSDPDEGLPLAQPILPPPPVGGAIVAAAVPDLVDLGLPEDAVHVPRR